MLQNSKKRTWLKISILYLLMVVLTAVPASATSAKTTTARDWLNKTITYCQKLDKSYYTAQTWKGFQKELKKAKAVLAVKKKADKVYSAARDELEIAKANLMFISSTDKGNPITIRELSVNQIVDEMGAGWNLGNTMDGHTAFTPSETCWQNVVTTKALIKSVHDMGFNTIRIPVTWGTMIDDNNHYAINEAWMSRVQDIVDYCVSQDIYTIITVFHDGAEQNGWIRISADDIDPVYEKYEAVWKQIAQRFKDYDEHLIFESMNEVTGSTTTKEHDMQVIMNLNQIFLNVVRTSGSNNSQRWLSVPGRYTNIINTTDPSLGFHLPQDTVKSKIFVSVHDYNFSFGIAPNMAVRRYDMISLAYLGETCQRLVEQFTSKGIPVILGEYGAVNKNNTAERAFYCEGFARICQMDGVVPCVWDQGWYDNSLNPDYTFSLVDRATGEELYPDVIHAIMRGRFLPAKSKDYSDIIKNPTVTKITDFTLSETALSLAMGESKEITTTVKPSDTNDLVIWKTADSTIATVSGGHVRARGIGTTTLTAFTQSGSVEKLITITVQAKAAAKPCTSILTDKDTYDLVEGQYVYLAASMKPSNTNDFITYKSSEEAIASISPIGKILACNKGTTTITITASSGLTKTIKVNVTENSISSELALGLYVFFNDSSLEYYSKVVGDVINVEKDGQYSLIFDISKNLDKAAITKGVKGLNNIGAIFIKDYNVDTGKITKSPIKSCNIMYNKIEVDGVELTINQTKPNNAMKNSGIFDTNNPLNAYDGSMVNEVEVSNNVLNITGVKNPQKITITFTLSDLVFNKK